MGQTSTGKNPKGSTLAVTLLGIETTSIEFGSNSANRSTLAVTLLGIETNSRVA